MHVWDMPKKKKINKSKTFNFDLHIIKHKGRRIIILIPL